MHEVSADASKNRLYVIIEKLDGQEEIIAMINEIKDMCKTLEKGFTCLTDLRKYEIWDDKDLDLVTDAQQAMVDAGLGKVVRVRKKFDAFGHFQFDRSSIKVGYHAQNATTIEEAEQILDDFQKDE